MKRELGLGIEKLRPHHILCDRFVVVDFSERGKEFERIDSMIKDLMRSDSSSLIEVIQGVDALCRACTDCRDGRCESPQGNEDEVRKWDAIILRELGILYGEKKTVKEFRELIRQKAPLDFCRNRCPWKTICTVFDLE